MSSPKISVIVPVYNVEKYLSECLDSIVNQTLKDIEIICLNDGSTDNSLSILKEYALKDERIILIDKENDGSGYTRKIGLDNAKGEYILFCDSDDYYAELTAFEELYNYIEKVKVDVVIFDFIQKDEITKNVKKISDTYDQNVVFTYRDIKVFFDHVALCWQKIYSRNFLTKYDDWYFPKYIKYEDVPFHYQVMVRAKISYFNRYFYVWRIRQNSISTKKISSKNILDNLTVTKKIYEITKGIVNNLDFLDYFYHFFCVRLFNFFIRDYLFVKDIKVAKQIIETIKSFDTSNLFDLKNREVYFYIRAGLKMTPEGFMEYFNRKILRYANEQIKYRDNLIKNQEKLIKAKDEVIIKKDENIKEKNEAIVKRDEQIKEKNEAIAKRDQQIKEKNEAIAKREQQIKEKNDTIVKRDEQIKEKNEAITLRDNLVIEQDCLIKKQDCLIKNQNCLIKNQEYLIKNIRNEIQNLRTKNNIQNQTINRLQNSLSYHIGDVFTYPLLISLGLFEYSYDYDLLKKSDLFDSEYYLANNLDVKKAKVDPIKHYLKFGWKEGRNPSAEFDGNAYLTIRPEARVAGICPLVHYLKFGKGEDLSSLFEQVKEIEENPNKEYFDSLFINIEDEKYDYLLSKRGEEILFKLENQKRKGREYKKGTEEEVINEAFDRIDVIFFNNKNLDKKDILQKYIDTVPELCPHKLLEIISQRIAEYTFPKRENYIFLDFSILAIVDNKSGIQRVSRNIIRYLPDINKRKIVFVHSNEKEFAKQGFRYCSKIADGIESENEEVIEFIQGDILFFPELSMLQCIGKKEYLQFLRKKGVKIINFVYDLIPIRCPETIPNNGFKEEFRKYIDSVLDYATGIICDSQFVKSDLQNYVRENRPDVLLDNLKIEWIHLGSDFRKSSNFIDNLPKDSNIVFKNIESRITFLAVSTIQPHKMYDQILEAFEILWSKNQDINLVIVGQNGWDSEKLIETISNHKEINKRLFKLTQINDEYLNKVYEKSSCFIMASKIEGFGLGIIEAVYHKKPLLIRDLPVFKEIAGENAFYFSGFKGEDLASAIEKWLLLYKQNNHPKSDKIKYLTWKESIQMLSDKLELLSR